MCGICGFFSLNERETKDTSSELPIRHMTAELQNALREMMAVQQHRGPDDQGIFCDQGIGLGFCRLAILDLTEAGHQPMSNEDGTVWLVFNGEIYNFRELVATLERAGHVFRSHSDSEVIIHAYEQWGSDCLHYFNGMFAFAIWDSRKRIVFMARDRLGAKPLYYWSDGQHFAFSSELKALLTLPAVPRRLNTHALQTYLRTEYVPAPESIFADIQKLPAGHSLMVRLDGSMHGLSTADWQPYQYWDVHFRAREGKKRSLDSYAEELRELLKAAVARRLISDVPLGVFLSGGLDSSSIVALMSELSTERTKTFSIGFDEKSFSELEYALAVAQRFHTEHHVEILKPNAHDLIGTIARVLDEPFADASMVPTYLVAQAARKHVTVVLSGDAGDEIFAGYDWYRAQRVAAATVDLLPAGMRQQLGAIAAHIPPSLKKKSKSEIVRRFLEGTSMPPEMQHLRWQTFWQYPDLAQLLTIPLDGSSIHVDQQMLELLAACGSIHPLDQQQYADIKRYLPDDILFKVDRMSMAVSLETRSPFLDYTLVEFAAQLPPSLRLHGGVGKYLLKQSMRDLLPEQILHRRKLGFNIPYKNWLRHELRDLMLDALSPAQLKQHGLFHPVYVQRLIHEHLEMVRDHAHKLWQLLIFQLWAQHYLSGNTSMKVPILLEQQSIARR